MTTLGYTSKGYSVPSGSTDPSNNSITSVVAGRDLGYASSLTSAGVIMINGLYLNTTAIYPIWCSTQNYGYLNIPTNVDDAYLVYPDYGFQIFYNDSYDPSNTYSRLYFNTSNVPVIFYISSTWSGVPNCYPIFSSSGATYNTNQTQSIQIYYRGAQVNVTGLGS
jgi:hypothetical protein